jgi:hypothetical protein
MTRDEFVETITTWDDLIVFCSENELAACDDICTETDMDYDIDTSIEEYIQGHFWYSLLEFLEDIERGYDWYVKAGFLEFYPAANEDFERRKALAIDQMDGHWDEDYHDELVEDIDETYESTGEEQFDVESLSIPELISVCYEEYMQISV